MALADGDVRAVPATGNTKGAVGVSPFPLDQTAVIRPLAELEATFERDFYSLFWDMNRENPLYAVATVVRANDDGQDGTPIAYSVFELCAPDSGEIKYGFYEAPLLDVPVTYVKAQQRVKQGFRLALSLEPVAA